jgi:hypothetical protein
MVDNSMPPNMGTGGMGVPVGQPKVNPLKQHLRQPKIYITLPSKGQWWPKGSIDYPENGEIPVYAMTARDEITFKTPDALLNGQATVNVIQSCIPNIKDAWTIPSVDLDVVLVAIRMASYGETIDMSAPIPNTQLTRDYNFNIQQLYDQLQSATFQSEFPIEGFTVKIKPVTYRTSTQQAIKAFEEQRVFSIIENEDIDPKVKLERFQKSFANLTDINQNVLIDSVTSITPNGGEEVTNPAYLKEFLEGCDASVFNAISDHIKAQKEKYTIKPLTVKATKEEIEAGAPESFELPITFDQSNFFGSGS